MSKRLARPSTIEWNLLSERRLGIVPVLKVIKEHEEKAGKPIVLKSDDTDVETNRRSSRFPRNRVFRRRRRFSRRNTDKGGAQNGEGGGGAGKGGAESGNEGDGEKRRPQRRRIRRPNRSKENNESENNADNNESSDGAGAGENRRKGGGRRGPRREGGENKERPQRRRGGGGGRGGEGGAAGAGAGGDAARGRPPRNSRNGEHRICVKLTNVSQESRARDIKQSLRERQCNPSRIVMKGDTCYVHYFKPEGDTEAASNQIIEALAGLTIKSESGERPEYPVNVELLKAEKPAAGPEAGGRVETTDVTAV